jgi:hypothetical protein
MQEDEAIRKLKEVFSGVDSMPQVQNLIRSAARGIILRDFNRDFPNPMPPRLPSRLQHTREVNVPVEPKYGYNPVPGAFGSRKD